MPASWQVYPHLPFSFPDGVSQTILFAEKLGRCGSGGTIWGHTLPDQWMPVFAAWSTDIYQIQPSKNDCDPRRASTPFTSGLNVALADGSVRSLMPGMPQSTWWAACTPAGDEVLGPDW